jgi:ArsR family transcriptional regulator
MQPADTRDRPTGARGSPPAPPPAVLEIAAGMLRAAGEAGRLSLLLRLEGGERSVSALAEDEGEKIATVSARLKLLHAARLVTRRREARHVFYALADGYVARLLRDVLDHAAEGASSAKAREGGWR